jgi:site-specific recombinase XerD
MSYETYRNELYVSLLGKIPEDQLLTVMRAADAAAVNYDFTRKETAITVYGAIPDAVKQYIASKAVEGCVPGTLYGYKQILTMFFAAVRKPLQEVIPNDVRSYLAWYRQTRQITGSTADRIRRVLFAFFNWCIEEDLTTKNPVKKIDEIHSQKKKLRGLYPMELEYIRSACRNDRERALIEFMYSTGCRASEVINMKVSSLDISNGTAEVFHGKGDKDRTVFLNSKSIVALQAYLASRRYDSEYLFNSTRAPGGAMTTKAVRNMIISIAARVADKIRIKTTPHTIRRTTATIAWRNGMPVEQIRIMLGHSKLETTMRYIDFDCADVKRSHSMYVA